MTCLLLLAGFGLFGGFASGLLGIGGSIIMIPLLLFGPQVFGFAAPDMRTVSAMSMVQVFFAAMAGAVVHRRNQALSRPLVLTVGLAGALGGLAGALASRHVSAQFLLLLFATLTTAAALLMFIPRREGEILGDPDAVPFHRPLAVLLGLGVGLVGGLVGSPGGFLYVPLLMYVLGIPTRITVGSTLMVVLLNSMAGVVGKFAAGLVPLAPSLALVAGAIPGARLGSHVSRRVPVWWLRWLLTAVVLASTAKVWLEVIR